jgi:hypothetical protein
MSNITNCRVAFNLGKYNRLKWGTEHGKGNKMVPKKVATTGTEDVYKKNTKTSTTI